MIQQMIVDYLFNEENKKKLIDEMNKAVDIPFIGEKTEEKILNAIYESIEDVVKNAMIEKL